MEEVNLTDDEVIKITQESSTRERAFFTFIRQTGLNPNTIKELRIKHLERILELDTPIPCKIEISREIDKSKLERHPAFLAAEAIHYIKAYLLEREYREQMTTESLLFIVHNKPDKKVSVKEISRTFKKTAHKIRQGKPDVQLSTLTDFFWNKIKEAKIEPTLVNYITGDTLQPSKNTAKDDEFYRRLYEQSLMNYLDIELINYKTENRKLQQRLNLIEEAVRQFLAKTDEQETGVWKKVTDPLAEAEKIEQEIQEFEAWEYEQEMIENERERLQAEQEAIQPQLDYEYEMQLEAEAQERETTPEAIERERRFAQFTYERQKEREKEEKLRLLQEAFRRISASRKSK